MSFPFVSQYGEQIIPIIRWLFIPLSLLIIVRCAYSLFSLPPKKELWAYLVVDEERKPLSRWENLIGRAKSNDISIPFMRVRRHHAMLLLSDDGSWYVKGLKGEVHIGEKLADDFTELNYGESFRIDCHTCVLEAVPEQELTARYKSDTFSDFALNPIPTMWLLTLMQFLCAVCYFLSGTTPLYVSFLFLLFSLVMWMYGLIAKATTDSHLELELLAFFLATLGLAVAASSSSAVIVKQFIANILGLAVFTVLRSYVSAPRRAMSAQKLVMLLAVAVFAANIVFGTDIYGSRNWVIIGGFSIQPSELVKLALILVGAVTLDKTVSFRNSWMFVLLSVFCMAVLAFIADYGTAFVFCSTSLVIFFLRSYNIKRKLAVIFAAAAVVGLAVLVVKSVPHVAERFSNWGSAWSTPYDAGFQQTRAMTAAASGGLVGRGPGRGNLIAIVAANTDLVFGVLCEEWGFIIAALAVIAMSIPGLFAFIMAHRARSAFHTIASCGAASMLIVQTLMNTMGCMDILPFTGVTFPFVSVGGTSVVVCWGLLAYIKSADTRFDDRQYEAAEQYEEY